MPVYEYVCSVCSKKFSLLIGVTAESESEKCPHCGSLKFVQVVSRVARARSEDERLDELADKFDTMGEPESYSQMRETMREAGSALDDGMADEMEEMLESDSATED